MKTMKKKQLRSVIFYLLCSCMLISCENVLEEEASFEKMNIDALENSNMSSYPCIEASVSGNQIILTRSAESNAGYVFVTGPIGSGYSNTIYLFPSETVVLEVGSSGVYNISGGLTCNCNTNLYVYYQDPSEEDLMYCDHSASYSIIKSMNGVHHLFHSSGDMWEVRMWIPQTVFVEIWKTTPNGTSSSVQSKVYYSIVHPTSDSSYTSFFACFLDPYNYSNPEDTPDSYYASTYELRVYSNYIDAQHPAECTNYLRFTIPRYSNPPSYNPGFSEQNPIPISFEEYKKNF